MVFEKLKTAFSEHLTHTRFISRKVGFSRRSAHVPLQSRLFSASCDDLVAFPTDEPPPAVPSTRTILRWFAAALTYRLAEQDPEIWRTASHLFHGISNIKSRVNYVFPRNSPIAGRLPFTALNLKDPRTTNERRSPGFEDQE
jgi:hypothetical protein